eukprot:CAMPEP_0168254410 /NCGR_PEP_ID=MMETSP0141_2-20121125/4727_1 /TAXON_ID=44445 /ORGANISM="Pseudo-nitzschia australis, Strain 10249 10 AB" /LENGTH=162 /DNA_ID=CAMNT_0008190883 /DNA_START=185 /DNA_END=674 /DNA_ORIENTATION=-
MNEWMISMHINQSIWIQGGKEHVESNLDGVEEQQSMLARDELEVDKVNGGPDFPRSLASRKKIGLDLGSNGCGRVSVDKSEVGEEDGHEKRTPHGLVDKDLFGNRSSVLSGDLGIEPVVEVVTGRSVVEKTEDRKSDESLHVEWTPSDEDLNKFIVLEFDFF